MLSRNEDAVQVAEVAAAKWRKKAAEEAEAKTEAMAAIKRAHDLGYPLAGLARRTLIPARTLHNWFTKMGKVV